MAPKKSKGSHVKDGTLKNDDDAQGQQPPPPERPIRVLRSGVQPSAPAYPSDQTMARASQFLGPSVGRNATDEIDAALKQLTLQPVMRRAQPHGRALESTAWRGARQQVAPQTQPMRGSSVRGGSVRGGSVQGGSARGALNPHAVPFAANATQKYPVSTSARKSSSPPVQGAASLPIRPTPRTQASQSSSPNVQRSPRRVRSPPLDVLPRPEPTHDYLNQATDEPITVNTPRKLLVILDLNGVLIWRKNNNKNRTAHKARPGVSQFLEYLFANHHVMVWSSVKPENLGPICRSLFSEEQQKQLFGVWSRKDLQLGRYYRDRCQVYKQLNWVWASSNNDLHRFDQTNTVLIDDSRDKAAAEPFNLVKAEEWNGLDLDDTALAKISAYIDKELRWTSDVSQYIYRNPFTAKAEPIAEVEQNNDNLTSGSSGSS